MSGAGNWVNSYAGLNNALGIFSFTTRAMLSNIFKEQSTSARETPTVHKSQWLLSWSPSRVCLDFAEDPGMVRCIIRAIFSLKTAKMLADTRSLSLLVPISRWTIAAWDRTPCSSSSCLANTWAIFSCKVQILLCSFVETLPCIPEKPDSPGISPPMFPTWTTESYSTSPEHS